MANGYNDSLNGGNGKRGGCCAPCWVKMCNTVPTGVTMGVLIMDYLCCGKHCGPPKLRGMCAKYELVCQRMLGFMQVTSTGARIVYKVFVGGICPASGCTPGQMLLCGAPFIAMGMGMMNLLILPALKQSSRRCQDRSTPPVEMPAEVKEKAAEASEYAMHCLGQDISNSYRFCRRITYLVNATFIACNVATMIFYMKMRK
ncbi:uncharacterized protein LOC142336803 [Convolutriloba macropyga]|uniref:uncharacterized protein LOC142336803 n=1 Tax=Convolutriloba macropyga TaxID=536237 RepID=UPI003F525D2A